MWGLVWAAATLLGCAQEPTSSAVRAAPACAVGTPELCGDGFDTDCDGEVDEGCPCTAEQIQACYPGRASELEGERTACRVGTQLCEAGVFGRCVGYALPEDELCDGRDDDCDGLIDEGLTCANHPPRLRCPEPQAGPPLAFYPFEAHYSDPDGDPMAEASWRLARAPRGTAASPEPAAGLQTRIFADLQGVYELELVVRDVRGAEASCRARLEAVSNDGIRVELGWNLDAAQDMADVDLHLRRGPDGAWFDSQPDGDDCFWRNCRICDEDDEALCRELLAAPDGPPAPRLTWTAPVGADDPRLDLDDVRGFGPENINITRPAPGRYRVGVHHWDSHGSGDAHAVVRIYCKGRLAREFEPARVSAPGGFGGSRTEFWEVADILWEDDDCQVEEIGWPGCRVVCPLEVLQAEGGCPEYWRRGWSCQ